MRSSSFNKYELLTPIQKESSQGKSLDTEMGRLLKHQQRHPRQDTLQGQEAVIKHHNAALIPCEKVQAKKT